MSGAPKQGFMSRLQNRVDKAHPKVMAKMDQHLDRRRGNSAAGQADAAHQPDSHASTPYNSQQGHQAPAYQTQQPSGPAGQCLRKLHLILVMSKSVEFASSEAQILFQCFCSSSSDVSFLFAAYEVLAAGTGPMKRSAESVALLQHGAMMSSECTAFCLALLAAFHTMHDQYITTDFCYVHDAG